MRMVPGRRTSRIIQCSDASPAWSPDGTKIVFRRIHTDSDDGNDEIYLMNADGTGKKDLTNNLVDDNSAVWSPDGTKIAFISNRNLGNYEIYVMNPERVPGRLPSRMLQFTVIIPHGVPRYIQSRLHPRMAESRGNAELLIW